MSPRGAGSCRFRIPAKDTDEGTTKSVSFREIGDKEEYGCNGSPGYLRPDPLGRERWGEIPWQLPSPVAILGPFLIVMSNLSCATFFCRDPRGCCPGKKGEER